ncbi:hypothetical protein [Corynebacterium anserum]|nr:hypothetical protein [Corynebacterium anserum]
MIIDNKDPNKTTGTASTDSLRLTEPTESAERQGSEAVGIAIILD